MRRTRLAEASIVELKNKLNRAKTNLKKLENYRSEINKQFLHKAISGEEYNKIIRKDLGKGNLESYIHTYEKYIQDSEKIIKEHKKEILKDKIIKGFLGFFFIGIFLAAIFSAPTFIGFFTQEPSQEFVDDINLNFNQLSVYEWTPENHGILDYVKLSGIHKGKGNVKIYLDEFLIYDSSPIINSSSISSPSSTSPSTPPLTGNVINTPQQFSFFEKMFAFTGFFTEEENFSQIIEDSSNTPNSSNVTEQYSSTTEEGAAQQQTSPSEEQPSLLDETTLTTSSSSTTDEGVLQQQTSPSEEEPPLLDENQTIDETETIENQTQEANETLVINETIEPPVAPEEQELFELNLVEVCKETCNLGKYNLNKSSYQIRIEISDSELTIQNISYGIIPFAKEEANITEINITELNITDLNITEPNIKNISLIQGEAVLFKPVKWTKKIQLETPGNLITEIPENAENIIVNKINEAEEKTEAKHSVVKKEKISKDISTEENASEYELTYETPAPYSIEEETLRGKKVKVIGQEEVHYENVLSFANLSETFNVKNPLRVKIYWIENQTYIQPTKVEDKDSNEIYDYVEWIAPLLSNQTFEIIVITKAEHLDKDRIFISDIYEQVKELDNVWSEEISNDEYVRVTFEQNLTSEKDITLFPRKILGNPKIEVYEKDEDILLAEFSSIADNQSNQVFLTNLLGEQDTFDLRVVGGSAEFEHIIDPGTEICNGNNCVVWFNSTGADTWTAPSNAVGNTITIMAWGGGGAGGGGGGTNKYGGGGGAGGQFVLATITITPSQQYNVYVGAGRVGAAQADNVSGGNTTFNGNTVIAQGGWGGRDYDAGAAGATGKTAGSVGNLTYAGGWGANGATTGSGAGGGGAGTTGNGGNASAQTGGTGTANFGGNGGAGSTANAGAGGPGLFVAGAGGGATKTGVSGSGGNGMLRINYTKESDNNIPQFSNYGGTANNTPYTYGGSYVFNATVTYTNGTVRLQINGINYTASNTGGNTYSATVSDFSAGVYPYVWYAWGNGTDKILNSSQSRDYYIAKATPIGSVTGTSPIPYGTPGNVEGTETNTGDSDVFYKLYRNGTEVSNPDTAIIVHGTYGYVYNTTGGQNYSASASLDTFQLVVEPSDYCHPKEYNFLNYANHVAYAMSADTGTVTTAYLGAGDTSNPPLFSDVFIADSYNLTSAGYTALQSVDTLYANTTSSTPNDEPFAYFNLTIDESEDSIIWINVTMVQNQIAGTDTDCNYYIANWTSETFVAFGASMSGTTDVQRDYNYSGSSITDLVNDNNVLTILTGGQQSDGGTGCRVNYVGIVVSYIQRVYPQFTDYGGTANNTPYTSGASHVFNVTVTYTNGTVWLEFNGINYTATNYTFDNYNATLGNFAAGNYDYRWWAYGNGTEKDINKSQTRNYYIAVNPEEVYTLFNTTSPVTYPVAFTVFSNSTTAFTIYRNGTPVDNNSLQGLAAGTYNFTTIRTDSQNYSDVYDEETFQVDKNNDDCGVVFNETSPIYFPNSFLVWHNCTTTATLYRNGTPIENNSEQALAVDVYNFTVIRADTENYTNYYDERNFVVAALSEAPTLNAKATSPATIYTDTDTILNATCWDGDAGDTITAWSRVWLNTGGGYTQDESDSSIVVTNATNTQIYNYTSGNYSKGNAITFEVWCDDGTENSTHENTTEIVVQDSIPTTPTSANLNTTIPYTNDAVLCTAAGSTDADSDSINYWYKFNESAGTLQDWSTSQTFDCATAGCDVGDTVTCWALASTTDANSSEYQGQSFTVQNTIPTIDIVWNTTMTDLSSSGTTEAPLPTYVIINFTASDIDGYANLDDTSAVINFSKTLENTRENASCVRDGGSVNTANYTCNVTMWWWDGAGDWNIQAYIKDDSGEAVTNTSANFYIGATSGVLASPSSLDFAEIVAGSTNQLATNNPILLNNTGNTVKSIQVNATDLVGESNPDKALYSENFSANTANLCEGDPMSENSFVQVTGASLPKGNYTLNDETAQEKIYFCLEAANSDLSVQYYSTDARGAWTIKIFAVLLAYRRRKSRKKLRPGLAKVKKEKEIEKDSLFKSLIYIKCELKKDYSSDRAELLRLMVKELCKRYSLAERDISKLAFDKEISIPLSIFSDSLGALEAVVKYMRENLSMNYSEIGKLLERDERTIWTAYNKSKEKLEEPFKIKERDKMVSLSAFNLKKLTILEALIFYLKQKGMKYTEISKTLSRDQRNVWAIYNNARTKLQ